MGIHAERVPLSGASHYRGESHDIDIHLGWTTLIGEVKSRGRGQGFTTIEKWLSTNDCLFLVKDRAPPMICFRQGHGPVTVIRCDDDEVMQ
jgi:hypothetical protein